MILLPALAVLAGLYGAAVWVWRRLPVESSDPGVPVISVGSISVGGTGKTPVCMYVAREFARRAVRVCILSRGYRRKGRTSPLVVSDGERVVATVEEAGDEPYMMARRLAGVGVVVGRDRIKAALEARRSMNPDLVILDDGFQYRHIAKRAEIVCLDWDSMRARAALPLGPLREGRSAIGVEHIVVFFLRDGEARPQQDDLDQLGCREVFYAGWSQPVHRDGDGNEISADDMSGSRVAIVSGIARPGRFETTCLAAGLSAPVTIRFDDHHWYTQADANTIKVAMSQFGCDRLVTTEKDIHKLPADLRQAAVVLEIDTEIDDADRFFKTLAAAIAE